MCHWYDSVRVQSRMSLVYASYVYVFMYSRLAIWWTSTLQVFGVPASVSRKCKETLWSPTCHEGNSSDSKSWSEHHEMIEMVLTTYYKSDDQWPFHVESPFEHPNLKSLYKCFFSRNCRVVSKTRASHISTNDEMSGTKVLANDPWGARFLIIGATVK